MNADATLTADRLNENLSAPTNLAAPEDATTPTSIKLTWGKVDGATSYDLKVDGTVFAVGDAAEFTHTDLAYNSKHTYQIRSRNAEGYSAWSDVLEANSALDPWRNVPDAEEITWEGSLYGSHKAELAFDHEFQSATAVSTPVATIWARRLPLTMDALTSSISSSTIRAMTPATAP